MNPSIEDLSRARDVLALDNRTRMEAWLKSKHPVFRKLRDKIISVTTCDAGVPAKTLPRRVAPNSPYACLVPEIVDMMIDCDELRPINGGVSLQYAEYF